jgi:hypothetical protein
MVAWITGPSTDPSLGGRRNTYGGVVRTPNLNLANAAYQVPNYKKLADCYATLRDFMEKFDQKKI